MKYSIVSRDDDISRKYVELIRTRLDAASFTFDEVRPELIIAVGGDGTLLEGVRKYQHMIEKPLFVGVHSGSLGFYTDWQLSEIDEFLAAVISKEYEVETFPLLETIVTFEENQTRLLALNEITISDNYKTLVLNICIDDVRFQTFRGTGICVSTPTGSTAYNKSLGGAVVHPEIQAFQLTEVASINNKVYRTIGSPMLFARNQEVKIKFVDVDNRSLLTNDHYSIEEEDYAVGKIKELKIRLADESVHFARFRKMDFWDRVHNAFL